MAKVEVTMPKMGESITEGTVIVWHKQPGDTVEQDETLLEIGTDKVDTEVPSPAAGVLQEILVPEGDTVDVGTVIAYLETDVDAAGADAPSVDAPEPEAQQAPPPEPPAPEAEEPEMEEPEVAAPEMEASEQAETTPPAPVADASTAEPGDAEAEGGERFEVVMPKMGESITEGTVIVWHKQPGDTVEQDETLLEIGTDKVDTEVPSPAAGVLQEILVPEGETVEVGTVIAIVGTAAVAPKEAAPAAAPKPVEPKTPSGDGAVPAQTAPSASVEVDEVGDAIPRRDDGGQFYSPLVRAIASKEGLSLEELQQIHGSGRDGRITKTDVLAYLEDRQAPAAAPQPSVAPSAPQPSQQPARQPQPRPQPVAAAPSTPTSSSDRVEIVPMDRMRQIIAEHMVRSKATSAHVTSFAEVDATNLVRLRERNKKVFLDREGVKLTYTPFFVMAAVEALREHPLLNASVEEKQIVIRKDLDIGIAVAIGKKGLVAPVIRNAGQKNLIGLAHAAADIATRARSKQLQPDELQGGTFTVTNVGSLGSLMGTPIINQPQVAILATGAIKKRPVVIEDETHGDLIAIRHMMYVSLSYDHRIIDGAMAASFLQTYTRALEALDPNLVL